MGKGQLPKKPFEFRIEKDIAVEAEDVSRAVRTVDTKIVP